MHQHPTGQPTKRLGTVGDTHYATSVCCAHNDHIAIFALTLESVGAFV